MRKTPVRDRLLAKVVIDQDSDCWVWTGSRSGVGLYGQIRVNGRLRYVHRVSYEEHVGPIPEDQQLDHVKSRGCVTTLCVNPAHLEPVSAAENHARSTAPGAYTARHGVCPRGHEQTPENTYITPSTGDRQCHACMKAARRSWRNRTKESTS